MKKDRVGLLLLSTLSLGGCNINLTEYSGDYSAHLSVQRSGRVYQENLTIRAVASDPKRLNLSGRTSYQNWTWDISTGHTVGEITLNTSGEIRYSGRLRKQGEANCFESMSIIRSSHGKVCFNDLEAEIEVSQADESIKLRLSRPYGGSLPKLEKPNDYTSIELRERARNMSFSSRIEFEKLVNAKLTARLKYLNLLPRISVNSALAIGTFSGIPGLIGSIGDFAPFLLPTRWIDARGSTKLLLAQQFAVKIMQLDAMQIVEGLCMVIGRDSALLRQLKIDREQYSLAIQEVIKTESNERIPPGSALSIEATANTLDQTINSLQTQLSVEMTDLAQSVGFTNPNAIASVSVQIPADIQSASKLDLLEIEGRTLSQAPELGQMDALIEAAKVEKIARGFQWLDPTGDPEGGLGAGLRTYIEIGQSNVRQLLIFKDQLNSTLLKKASDAYNDYLGWSTSYKLAFEGVKLHQKRIDKALQKLYSQDSEGAVEEIREGLGNLADNHVSMITAEYGWYVAVSRINRLIRAKPYDQL